MLERLTKTHNQYISMKNALIGDKNLYDPGLEQVSTNFPGAMKEIVTNPKSLEKVTGGNLLKEDGVSIGQRRKQIIESSFGTNCIEVEEEASNAGTKYFKSFTGLDFFVLLFFFGQQGPFSKILDRLYIKGWEKDVRFCFYFLSRQ